uniref:T9SS type A sorting domain-containing protein n=1 Tax=Ignavibacterium album TaxID=591197 RepID=A0A832LJG1_9BACT
MKYIICLLMILFSSSSLPQTVIIEANAILEVQNGADICVDSLGGSGTININGTFCGNITDVDIKIRDSILNIPGDFSLDQNYPNPFNPTTKIRFVIPASSLNPFSKGEGTLVTLKVYDMLGNEVATLVNEEKPAGVYEVNFSAEGLSSGTYFYKLQAVPSTSSEQGFVDIKKMILIR